MGNGADWIRKNYKIEEMSPLGEEVADLLDDVFHGIYHVKSHLHKTVWSDDYYIEVVLRGGLATFDFPYLTRLVVLCHDRLLRMEIEGRAPNFLTLVFYKRKSRTGSMMERHPTMESHVAAIRKGISDVDS